MSDVVIWPLCPCCLGGSGSSASASSGSESASASASASGSESASASASESGSGSGSGSVVITDICCGVVPSRLFVTLDSGVFAGCECLNTVVALPIDWDGSSKWTGITSACSNTVVIDFQCVNRDGSYKYWIDVYCGGELLFTHATYIGFSASCNPFYLQSTQMVNESPPSACCLGDITAVITE